MKNNESFEDLLKEYGDGSTKLQEGSVVKGNVIDKNSAYLIVDLNHKSYGCIPKGELKEIGKNVEVGDEIIGTVVKGDNGFGETVLSYKSAVEDNTWKEIKEGKDVIDVYILKKNRNGLSGVCNFINVFIPSSLVDTAFKFESEKLIGEVVQAKVVRADRKTGTIIASRRDMQISEEEKINYEDINIGDKYKVKVTYIKNFGAFVYFGGLDGLIHISDISWGYVDKIEDYVSIGDELEAIIVSKEKGRVALGLKQNNMKDWEEAKEKFVTDNKYNGIVKNIKRNNMILEVEGYESIVLDKNIEAGIPARVKKQLEIGDEVEVTFLDFDDNRNSLLFSLNGTQFKNKEVKEDIEG